METLGSKGQGGEIVEAGGVVNAPRIGEYEEQYRISISVSINYLGGLVTALHGSLDSSKTQKDS